MSSGSVRIIRSAALSGFVCVISLFFAHSGALADPDPTQILTVDDCVAIALEGNTSIGQAEADVDQAKGAVKQNMAGVLPNFSLNYNVQKSGYERTGDTPVGGSITTSGTEFNRRFGYNISQPLLNLPNLYNWRSSSQQQAASVFELENTHNTVRGTIRTQFYDCLASIKLAEVESKAVEVANEQLRRAETLFRLGSVARSDVLQAKVNLAESEMNEINRRNVVRVAHSRLAMTMGLDPRQDIQIDEDLSIPANDPDGILEDYITQAISNRPDLSAAQSRLRAAELSERASKLGWLPTVDFGYNGSKSHSGNDWGAPDAYSTSTSWGFGLTARLNIFDGFGREGRIQTATATKRSRREICAAAERDVILEIKDAFLSIRKERESLQSAESSVSLSEENLRLQQALYESGAGTLLEWDNARLDLRRAQVSLIQAQINLILAHTRFEIALGI